MLKNVIVFFLIIFCTVVPVSLIAQNPEINLSTNTLYSFRQLYVETMSDVQFYDIEAENLNSDLEITAEYPFKVSLDCYQYFENSLTIQHDNGIVSQRVFVRAFPGETGNFNATITHTSDDAQAVSLNVHVQSIENQTPVDYYSSATSTGSRLKTELHNIINNHNVQTYGSLWDHFLHTDATFSNKVWDMYSNTPCSEPPYIYTFYEDQDTGTGGNTEGDVYNREHSFPRSWFGGSVNPMHTDLHHIYPVDKWVNNFKAAYPLAVIVNPEGTSLNGSKRGTINVNGYSGLAFEPIDDYKGDLARAFFYMITRYENKISGWTYSDAGMAMLDNEKYPGYNEWAIDMLIEWHENDPVSQKEIARNDAVYAIQGNRNPFIDKPGFVNRIWGDTTDTGINNFKNIEISIYPSPSVGIINYKSETTVKDIEVYSINGKKLLFKGVNNNSGVIDLSGLPRGMYVVRFMSFDDVINKKIILEKP